MKVSEFPFISEKQFLPIRKWNIKDRPREKLLAGGMPEMTDEELLAILIGCGTEQYSALDIARKILHYFNGNLQDLSCRSARELVRKFTGIGEARAVSILAGMELGKRCFGAEPDSETRLTSSAGAFRILCKDLSSAPYEKFIILLLAQSGRLIRKVLISEGGLAATTVDAKKIFKFAIDEPCSGMILAHNHPSGNTKPSPEDIDITRKIYEGAKLLDLHVFDHLIISGKNYFSFADEKLILGRLNNLSYRLL